MVSREHLTVLVTGGGGFVGSHLVDALIEQGHTVVVIDHYKREKQRFEHADSCYYRIGFEDPYVEDILAHEKPDAIVHLAAQISVPASVQNPAYDAQVNILDSIALLEMAARTGVKQFLFASSGGAIYGDHPERPTPEVFDARPLSPYGISKQSLEHYLDFYRAQYGMRTGVLRFSNIYGPRQFSGGEASVVSIFINKLLDSEPAVIFGDGSSTRDFVYVGDAVQAFVCALDSGLDDVVNISSGSDISVVDLWGQLKQVHGEDVAHEFAPERPGEVARSCLSPKRAGNLMDWAPQTELPSGLRETYSWFKQQRNI